MRFDFPSICNGIERRVSAVKHDYLERLVASHLGVVEVEVVSEDFFFSRPVLESSSTFDLVLTRHRLACREHLARAQLTGPR